MKNSTTLAVRAIAAAFARQLLLPVIIGGGIVLLLLWIGLILLIIHISSWWLLATLVLIPITLVTTLIALVLWVLVRKLSPQMSPQQKKATSRFVERTSNYTELVGMSRFLFAFYIIRHAIQKKPGTYFDELLGHSAELQNDFNIVREQFSKKPRKPLENLEDKP